MFKKLYHKLFTSTLFVQLTIWVILFLAVFGVLYIIVRLMPAGPKGVSDLFHSMTSFDKNNNIGYALLYILGVLVFSGLLVMILTNGIRNKINRIERGDVRYSFNDHIVFLGYNEIVLGLLSSCPKKEKNKTDYVILVEKGVSWIKEEIIGALGERDNIYVLHGNRVSKDDLKSITIQEAKEVYLIGENETDADVINLQTLKTISSIGNSNSNRLFFLYNNQHGSFCSWDYCTKFLPEQFLNNNFLKIIDFDELSINNILGDPDNVWPDYKLHWRNNDTITWESDKYVHIVIFGVNEVSKKLVKAAANFCHFPNHYTKGINTLITIIDDNIGDASIMIEPYKNYFQYCNYEIKKIRNNTIETIYKQKQPKNCKFVDIDFEFIDGAQNDSLIMEIVKNCSLDPKQVLSIYTCQPEFEKNFDFSISLPQELFDNNLPIWVYAKNSKKISMLIKDKYPNVIPWGSCWETHAFGKWDRMITAIMCANLEVRNKEIPSYLYYQEFLDFASFLSIIHTSTTSSINGKNCSSDETRVLTITEYYRNCVRSLFRGDDMIVNLFIAKDEADELRLRTRIGNFDELDEIKYYYRELVLFGWKVFKGDKIMFNKIKQ